MRALWSAATGMKGIQLAIDNISNNLANVNTYGFKKQRTEFKDLLYEKLNTDDFTDGFGAPVNIEAGHGVMPSATVRDFSQGNLISTDNQLDMAIEGEGFFVVRNEDNEMRFTKDGAFKVSLADGTVKVSTSDGYFLQGEDGDIEIGEEVSDIAIDIKGVIKVKRNGIEEYEEIATVKLVKFANPAGLESIGHNLYNDSLASGDAIEGEDGDVGIIKQGFLELSNVEVVEEMINLIAAQRAYEINSKTIQTSDDMLELANNLKR